MKKIIKNNLRNFLAILLIFLIMEGWLFSGWPQIWQKPSFPPIVQEVKADITNLVVTACDINDIPNTVCYNAISADGGTSYALTKAAHIDAPFQTLEASSVNSTTLYYDSWGTLSGTWGIYVKDARDGTTICSVDPAPEDASETTNSIDCSSLTPTQLSNGVWLYVVNNDDKGPQDINIDYVRLNVDYTPAAVGTITVGATGNQVATIDIPSNDQYVGGAFTFIRDAGTADISQIIITETGTVNANLNLSNLDIYYETAVTCSYEGIEAFFGTAASFNASEKATVSGLMTVGTSQVCVYIVLDVGSGALDGETLEIEISNPSTEVTVSAGTVSPATPLAIAGTTTLQVPVVPPATWKASEDTASVVNKNENIRLRIEVANTTGSPATDYDYRLEYAAKVGDFCDSDESFIAIPVMATTEHFEMTDSTYFENGDPTTAQLNNSEGYTFVAGRMVEDPSNSSGNITLPVENYTEIEFVFQATTDAIDGEWYCFRLTRAGTVLDDYPVYPELQIAGP